MVREVTRRKLCSKGTTEAGGVEKQRRSAFFLSRRTSHPLLPVGSVVGRGFTGFV